MNRHLTSAFRQVMAILALTIGPLTAADQPEQVDVRVQITTPAALSLPDVLEHVRAAAAGDGWMRPGWADPAIEGWVNNALDAARAGGKAPDLPGAVKFADYKGRGVADPRRAAPFGVGPGGGGASLVVTNRLDETRLSNTLALVDGDAFVAFADNCVIVARGAVYIAHGGGNVVVAGQFAHVSHDGTMRRMAAGRQQPPQQAGGGGPAAPSASLLISGGTLNVSNATDTVLAAGGRLEVGHAMGCVFLNPPADLHVSHKEGCVEARTDRVRLGDPPKPHALAADVKLQSLNGDRGVVVFRYKGRRYVAEKGKPITDETDRPVPELDGWVVTISGSGYAVLGSERERASIVLSEGHQ